MQTLNLLEDEIGSINDARAIINEFHWFLNIDQIAGNYTVTTGEKVVFTADSREAVDAFLYGMALAYKGLPPELYAKLFGMMAGTQYDEDEQSPVDLDLVDTDAEDERLDDLTTEDLENIEAQADNKNDPLFE
ncbi:MAG: hypothetical protein Phog2KO_42530 [Phototrophicaceae bacterium]